MTLSMLDINILGALSLCNVNSGPLVIDQGRPIVLAKFGAPTQIYKASDIQNIPPKPTYKLQRQCSPV